MKAESWCCTFTPGHATHYKTAQPIKAIQIGQVRSSSLWTRAALTNAHSGSGAQAFAFSKLAGITAATENRPFRQSSVPLMQLANNCHSTPTIMDTRDRPKVEPGDAE